ncbi:cytochrome [Streptomyces yokosukanensis]|uniref:Cytochrome n=1 Tax=Streptomyces yokosukanensis TaxID=67386 RepID=A0A117PYS8_9ACTN|nr:cytochrome [Streptomyces yokosukanensis]
MPDGHHAWILTDYELIRSVLADHQRFSSRQELWHLPFPFLGEGDTMPPAGPGDPSGIDPPDHTRLRRAVAGLFTVRRMRQLTERIEKMTTRHLDAMEKLTPPVDLMKVFAEAIPYLTICELLAIPDDRRGEFHRQARTVQSWDAGLEERGAAISGIQEFLTGLVAEKRANPTDDMISDLAATELALDEVVGFCLYLLFAGMDTTANMIATGMWVLFSHPDQLAALREDPTLINDAVEELLRYLTVADMSFRTALEDVELGGEIVKAGETVVSSLAVGNRDPKKYPDPDRLDLRRRPTGHLAFSHGVHQCLGQQLARTEMQVAIPALLERFPSLRLAASDEEISIRTRENVYGVHSLPVSWEQA